MMIMHQLIPLLHLQRTTFLYINAKLANKVLKDVGLVISLFDIIEIGESHVIAGDGASHTKGIIFLL